jgi:hypothetical protein
MMLKVIKVSLAAGLFNTGGITNNLNICRPLIGPAKTNPELVIDANTPLAFSVAAKRLKMITRRDTHVIQDLRQIKLNKLA